MGFILILVFGLSLLIQWQLKSKFEEYSKIPSQGNLSGEEIAKKMLRENGIYDVKVVSVAGHLTDHYNPLDKTVNLSSDVFSGRTVAAAAVASHECGHAVQHAQAYPWLNFRSQLVPVISFAGKWVQWVLLAGAVLAAAAPKLGLPVLLIGIVLFAATTLFSFITLPVEFDASSRALRWLENSGLTSAQEHAMAKDALKWAAMTYVIAAVGSLANLLYYVRMFLNRR